MISHELPKDYLVQIEGRPEAFVSEGKMKLRESCELHEQQPGDWNVGRTIPVLPTSIFSPQVNSHLSHSRAKANLEKTDVF